MKYDVYLSPRAKKQYKKFDVHMRHKIRTKLLELEEDPSEKGSFLQGFNPGLHKIKIFHAANATISHCRLFNFSVNFCTYLFLNDGQIIS